MTGSVSANGYGLDPPTDTMPRALKEVHLDAGITIDFDLAPATITVLQHFALLAKKRKLSPASIEIRAGVNPIGGFAASGASPQPWNTVTKKFANTVGELASQGFRGRFALADGRIIHDAAGSEAQELGFAIATAVEYLRALEQGGISIDAARRMNCFRLSAETGRAAGRRAVESAGIGE